MRVRTGEYSIWFYDRYGGRIKDARRVKSSTLVSAIKKGRRYHRVCGYASYRVDRSIYNSLDW